MWSSYPVPQVHELDLYLSMSSSARDLTCMTNRDLTRNFVDFDLFLAVYCVLGGKLKVTAHKKAV